MYKLQMHSEWLIGDGGHILGMIFFKVKCLEYFGFGVKSTVVISFPSKRTIWV